MAKEQIDQGIIARLTGAYQVLTGRNNVTIDNGSAWFGPLNPPEPAVGEQQREQVAGRQFDFPSGYNIRQKPRSGENVTFEQMRALADNCDVLRIVIETRKDQLSKMKWTIKPRKEAAEPDKRCEALEQFFLMPDGENNWDDWLRQLLEEMLVTDAATIYPWMTNGSEPYRFELMDGGTIKRVLDARGRTPVAPLPAYQQVLKGLPAVNYTADELIYVPRNKRVHKVYGYSPVEQIIMTINIAIRRALHQLQYYTEGSTPDLLFQVPPDWNMAQIKEFNDWWNDSLAGNTANRRRAQFVPHGVNPVNTKEAVLKDPYDEWLARIVCYAFSVSPQPFIKENNRSTAETAAEAAIEEGLMPIMMWVKRLMDKIIWKYFGYTDLEFSWEDQDATDPVEQTKMDDLNVKNGTATINEVRARRGDPSIGPVGDKPMALTASGYVLITGEPPSPPPATPDNADGNQEGGSPDAAPADKKQNPKEPKPEENEPAQKIAKAQTVNPIKRNTKAHKKIETAIADGIAAVFKKQAKQLADTVVNKVNKLDVKEILRDFEFEGWDTIEDLFGTQLVLASKLGVHEAYAQLDLDDPTAFDLANEEAINYAMSRSAELVGKRINFDGEVVDNPNAEYSLDDATREMIRGDITTAMEQGLSNEDLADMLEENYAFSEARAETIARTETALADVQGNLVLYRQSGIVESKRWIVGDGCCEDCEALDGETVGLDEVFSDGSEAPPAHPNCRCDFIPVLTDEQGNENED